MEYVELVIEYLDRTDTIFAKKNAREYDTE